MFMLKSPSFSVKRYSRWGSVCHLCFWGFFLTLTKRLSHSPKSFCESKNLYSFAVSILILSVRSVAFLDIRLQ